MANTRVVGTGRDGVRTPKGQRPAGSTGAREAFYVKKRSGKNGCHGRTQAGKKCAAYAVHDEKYCIGHLRSLRGNA